MASYKKPDDQVTPFALYYREYRKAKKEGKVFKRGRPIITDETKLSQKPRAVYMRAYRKRKIENDSTK